MSAPINKQSGESLNGCLHAVRKTIEYARDNAPFYRTHFSRFDRLASDFTLADFKALPFTSKEDLSLANEDFLCVPRGQVAEYCTTSGTTGESITIFLTREDLENLGKNEARSYQLMGASANDVFQLLTTMDKQFMAGLAYYLGVQTLRAGMIRMGPGVPALQWKSIFQNRPTILIAVPSFIVSLIEYAKSNGIDFRTSSVRAILCIGESIREDDFSLNVLGKRIRDAWDVELYSTYASTEMGAAFTECSVHKGCHLNTELLYLEVLNDRGEEVEDGEAGEVVFTTLSRTGTPLVRYKTGDIARVYRENCSCGNRAIRLGPILGRQNQIIKYKGTTLFPNAIFNVLDNRAEINCYKVIVSKDGLGNDALRIWLENSLEGSEKMADLIEACRAVLRVVPEFEFMEKDYIYGQVFKPNIRKPEKIIFT